MLQFCLFGRIAHIQVSVLGLSHQHASSSETDSVPHPNLLKDNGTHSEKVAIAYGHLPRNAHGWHENIERAHYVIMPEDIGTIHYVEITYSHITRETAMLLNDVSPANLERLRVSKVNRGCNDIGELDIRVCYLRNDQLYDIGITHSQNYSGN